jgi:hypothetical protein
MAHLPPNRPRDLELVRPALQLQLPLLLLAQE